MEKLKKEIQDFWTRYPCAKNIINADVIDKDFFIAHDRIIEKTMPSHRKIFKYESCTGKRVLEIGCGMGAYARHCAAYAKEFYAIDLSLKSIELTKRRFELYGINNAHVQQGDAENLDFQDNFFDYVYSNGVIHHTPNTNKAACEIYRVLKPGGEAVVMIYNKNSVFYWLDLMLLVRMKYVVLKLMPIKLAKVVFKRKPGVVELKKFLDETPWELLSDAAVRFCDGHFNPHTKVYTKKEAERLFSQFKNISMKLCSPKGRWLENIPAIDKYFGWGLFITAQK